METCLVWFFKEIKRGALLGLVFASFMSAQAQFWQKDDEEEQEEALESDVLPTVLVTAHKQPTKFENVSKNLFSITNLRHEEGGDLSQVLDRAGLTINGANSNFSTIKQPYLRGSGSKYTLMLYDGVPLLNPAGLGGYDLRLLSSAGLRSVEVMRGSHSTLYGSGAVGGVIHLLSAPASDKLLHVEGYAAGGNLAHFRAALGVNGTFFRKKAQDGGISYRIDLNRRQSSGISEAEPKLGADETLFDKDGLIHQGINAHVLFSLKNWAIRPYFRHFSLKHDYDQGAFRDGSDRYEGSMTMGGLNIDWKYASSSTLRLKLAQEGNNGTYITDFPSVSSRGVLRFAELYTNHQLHERLELLAGLEYRYEQWIGRFDAVADPDMSTVSPYVTLHAQPFGKSLPIHLEVGVRANNRTNYGTHLTYDINPSYILADGNRVYASFSTAFLAPTLFNIYHQTYGNEKLKPEAAKSIEIGSLYEPLQLPDADRFILGWRLAAFYRSIDDLIYFSEKGRYENRDVKNGYGVEVEPTFYVGKQWKASFSYAYVYGKAGTRRSDGTFFYSEHLFRRPKHTYRLLLQWSPARHFLVRVHGTALGKRTDLSFSEAFVLEKVTLPAYALVDFYASYDLFKSQVLSLFLEVKNLLNHQDYREVYGYSVPGARYMLGLRFGR